NNLFSEEENIILSIAQKPEEPFPQPSLEEDSLFKSIKNSVDKILPGTLTLKAMSPASSESEILRKHGIITYGIGPLINSGEGGTHQSNENIALEDLEEVPKREKKNEIIFLKNLIRTHKYKRKNPYNYRNSNNYFSMFFSIFFITYP
ncbi:MAG: hypothetical protein IKS93_05605, partial [Methanobrevibacter sp.]|nr:hypothetical protein [Methanobrevibacter sp.]